MNPGSFKLRVQLIPAYTAPPLKSMMSWSEVVGAAAETSADESPAGMAPRCSGTSCAFEKAKVWKPLFHFIGSRVETRR
jgi:hypothetical protein